MKVLVSGATRGIGRAIVEALARQPENKIYCGCRDMVAGTAMATQLGGGAEPILLDVTDPASVVAAAAKLTASKVELDALVNNAGVLLEREGTDLATIVEPTMLVNVDGVINVTEQMMPLMRDGGLVVNVSS